MHHVDPPGLRHFRPPALAALAVAWWAVGGCATEIELKGVCRARMHSTGSGQWVAVSTPPLYLARGHSGANIGGLVTWRKVHAA